MTKEQKFLLLIVLIVAGASVTYYVNDKKSAQMEVTPVTQEVKVETNTNPITQIESNTQTSTAKKYLSTVNYNVPEEKVETIHVGITLKDGLIEDISFSYDTPKEDESVYNLGNFEKALATTNLKGKKLEEISFSRLGGASLTTGAFMKAVAEIKGKVNG